MIREDYIIGWIKRFVQMLAQIMGLVKTEKYDRAIQTIDIALQTLLDLGPDNVTTLSEGQIMARLIVGEPTQLVQHKCIMLAAILQQLGLVLNAQERRGQARDCFLKALHLTLGAWLGEPAGPLPEHTPKVEDLVAQLAGGPLPARTYAALMHYYERQGAYAKAEDALYAWFDAAPGEDTAREVGIPFYERLLTQSDAALVAGHLPRAEIQAGLAKLQG